MVRVRVRFQKLGSIRYISHLDTMRAFERCFRSCGFRMHFTKGYHPHPRIALGPPLKTGWESVDEYLDLLVEEFPKDIFYACNRTLPEGLSLVEAVTIPLETKSLTASIAAARLEISINEEALEGSRVAEAGGLNPAPGAMISRFIANMDPLVVFGREHESKKALEYNGLDAELLDLAVEATSGKLSIEYLATMNNGRGLDPAILLKKIFLLEAPSVDILRVVRRGLYIKKEAELVTPLDAS